MGSRGGVEVVGGGKVRCGGGGWASVASCRAVVAAAAVCS